MYRMHPLIPGRLEVPLAGKRRVDRRDDFTGSRAATRKDSSTATGWATCSTRSGSRIPARSPCTTIPTRCGTWLGSTGDHRHRDHRHPPGPRAGRAAVQRLPREVCASRVEKFEEMTPNPEWAKEIREVYSGDIDKVDIQVGMYAEKPPTGFGFSDTAFRIFILMASRRLKSDRFFTNDYTPEIYTKVGFDWVNNTSMKDVLLRHYPELKPEIKDAERIFAPWGDTPLPTRSDVWRTRSRPTYRSATDRVIDFAEASTLDGVRFTAQVAVPNVLQGLFRRRRRIAGIATVVGADTQAVRFYEGLVRDKTDRLRQDRQGRVAAGASARGRPGRPRRLSQPVSIRSDAKRKGMSHFQPDALTISRGSLWENRRRFAEAILDTGKPLHRLAQTSSRWRTRRPRALASGEITWERINDAFQRLTRRVILGAPRSHGTEISNLLATLMDEANSSPGGESKHFAPFMAKVRHSVDTAAPGSLAALVAEGPQDFRHQAGRATGALDVCDGRHAARQRVPNAGRTGHTSSPARRGTQRGWLRGMSIPRKESLNCATSRRVCKTPCGCGRRRRCSPECGTRRKASRRDRACRHPGLHLQPGNHRNRDRVSFADRFAPDEWMTGNAAQNWSFNFFSNGPQGCPAPAFRCSWAQPCLRDC